jgi:hypothetical protein
MGRSEPGAVVGLARAEENKEEELRHIILQGQHKPREVTMDYATVKRAKSEMLASSLLSWIRIAPSMNPTLAVPDSSKKMGAQNDMQI